MTARVLPSPTDEAAWADAATVVAIVGWAHTNVHPKPQHGCEVCPAVPCRECGADVCDRAFEHRRAFASSETTWRSA